MNYKIIDNFLSEEFYNYLSKDLKGEDIPWFFRYEDTSKKSILNKTNNGFFSFCYYNNLRPDHPLFDKHIVPILKKLNVISCLQVRANLTVRDKDHLESGFHTDCVEEKSPCIETAILYLTTCNAKTVLKIGEKKVFIDSLENRLLLFDNSIQHKVIYQNDCHKRYVINFNFIRNKNES